MRLLLLLLGSWSRDSSFSSSVSSFFSFVKGERRAEERADKGLPTVERERKKGRKK